MLLLWPCSLLLITLYLFVVNKCFLRLLKTVDFVAVVVVVFMVNVVVVALLVLVTLCLVAVMKAATANNSKDSCRENM